MNYKADLHQPELILTIHSWETESPPSNRQPGTEGGQQAIVHNIGYFLWFKTTPFQEDTSLRSAMTYPPPPLPFIGGTVVGRVDGCQGNELTINYPKARRTEHYSALAIVNHILYLLRIRSPNLEPSVG